MENSRDGVHSFMTRFEQHEIKFQHTISREIEPHLKYLMVDRYAVNQLSSELLRDLMSLTDIHNDIEIFFAFGYLCIGYCERDYGNCMRLDAFVSGQLVDLTDQADKDFVTPVLSAAAAIQDKAMGAL
jgi:hypothetical protein